MGIGRNTQIAGGNYGDASAHLDDPCFRMHGDYACHTTAIIPISSHLILSHTQRERRETGGLSIDVPVPGSEARQRHLK
jgi:hypothetical protein